MGLKDCRLIRSGRRNSGKLSGVAVQRKNVKNSRRGGGCDHWQKIPEMPCNSSRPFGGGDDISVRHEGLDNSTKTMLLLSRWPSTFVGGCFLTRGQTMVDLRFVMCPKISPEFLPPLLLAILVVLVPACSKPDKPQAGMDANVAYYTCGMHP